MGKKSKKKNSQQQNKKQQQQQPKEEIEENDDNVSPILAEDDVAKKPELSEDESSVSSEEEADDLVLEGVLVRNPDASDSSSDEDDDDDNDGDDDDGDDSSTSDSDDDSEEEEEEEDSKPPPTKKQKSDKDDKGKKSNSKDNKKNDAKKTQNKNGKKNNKKKKKKGDDLEIIPVEFTFCDMHEKYFHGLKTLLTATSPVYAAQSSELSDLMIESLSVGTVVGCEEGGDPDTAFGFASVLNFTDYGDRQSIQALKKICLEQCPSKHKKELETVLSGKTKRPAGFYLHGRMVNLPMEIVEILHQQLVIDMDWAVEHAEGGEAERKSLDFGAFVRIAPSYRMSGGGGGGGSGVGYKYFDDEVFADHAEFSYEIKIPKTFGMEETPYCMVIVMTKTGHRAAMKALSKMVNGT